MLYKVSLRKVFVLVACVALTACVMPSPFKKLSAPAGIMDVTETRKSCLRSADNKAGQGAAKLARVESRAGSPDERLPGSPGNAGGGGSASGGLALFFLYAHTAVTLNQSVRNRKNEHMEKNEPQTHAKTDNAHVRQPNIYCH